MSSLFEFEFPDRFIAHTAQGEFSLDQAAHGGGFSGHGVDGRAHSPADNVLAVDLQASQHPIFSITLEWNVNCLGFHVLADAWERAYGDLEWCAVASDALTAPWYFAATQPTGTASPMSGTIGVKTGGGAMASWHISPSNLALKLDVRSGNRPLRFVRDQLRLAEIVLPVPVPRATWSLQRDLKRLCDHPMRVHAPVYGVNDWYYAYGHNTATRLLEDSKRAAEWARGLRDRPFSVIDDGWSAGEGTWSRGNANFPDMPRLAENIAKAGCRPGLWVRPLLCDERVPESWFMAPKTLDPSNPDVLRHVHDVIYRIHGWGYELIKHDYSTYDVCELWGFQMADGVAGKNRTFSDQTRTTAEILTALYSTIRAASGSSLVLGCNTVGHLAAGHEEIQRIGDDTSGREWARTVKMGVNSLAYRGSQQGAFFQADPDCVAVTADVAWGRTKTWLDLVANSGTVLFVSAQQEALGPKQRRAISSAFQVAAKARQLATPSVLESGESELAPTRWATVEGPKSFEWN